MDACILGLFLYVASVWCFIIAVRRETNKTRPNHQTERVAGWGEVVKEGEDQNSLPWKTPEYQAELYLNRTEQKMRM